jgi:hypothetical protein
MMAWWTRRAAKRWQRDAAEKAHAAYRQTRDAYDGLLVIPLASYVIRIRGNAWFRLTIDPADG